jgi:lipoprotein-anchoring transpeptidase ErfK/SrfK
MRRLISASLAAGALMPAVVVGALVLQVPSSALAVPKVEVSGTGATVKLDAASLGARRTTSGLRVSERQLNRKLAELARSVGTQPVAGDYRMTPDGVVLDRGTPGTRLDVDATRELLVRALRGGPSTFDLPMVATPAPDPPPFAIIVRLSDFRLDLYEGAALRAEYPVAVGQLRFPTPPGVYHIKSKAKNPAWNNPGSAWARDMPAYVPPGPKNPLGTRALRLDREALVIHGTPNPSSVGRRASHGCMRMYRADVEALYDVVATGAPVFIIP